MQKNKINLFDYAGCFGWASKLDPAQVEQIVKKLSVSHSENLLVGTDTADDAGIIRFTDNLALVETVDILTPISPDAYIYGQIASANSLSDIYAMGAKPISAMNILAFPGQSLNIEVMREILEGGAKSIELADAILVGGHTMDDEIIKYGLAVIGVIHPDKIVRNCTAKPGDKLVLTKPIGTGILTFQRAEQGLDNEVIQVLENSMMSLNRTASELMIQIGVNACTDITGFGLAGHLYEMMHFSKTGCEIIAEQIPLFPQVRELVEAGIFAPEYQTNKNGCKKMIEIDNKLPTFWEYIFYDPQTSGGLLISIQEHKADIFVNQLRKRYIPASIIGTVTDTGVIKLV